MKEYLSGRFKNALDYAFQKHQCQPKKGKDTPYFAHLMGVCSIVLEMEGTEEQAMAALLHDAAEDQGGLETLNEIRQRFGEKVYEIVEACTDTLENPKPDWLPRKKAYLEHLLTSPVDSRLVSLADKVYNLSWILRDYRAVGDTVWQRFTPGKEDLLWYYCRLEEIYQKIMPGNLEQDYSRVLTQLLQEAAPGSSRGVFTSRHSLTIDKPGR